MPAPHPPDNWAEKHVPFYKNSERAWGAVNRILAIPCAPDPVVYIDAAIKGLWKIGYSIASPDPKELYHQLIGNSLYHDIKQGAEDTRIVKPREVSPFTRTVFKLADIVDVTLWWMFVFGAVTDGLVDFSTQLQKYAGCDNRHSPNFFSGGPYINAIGDDGRFYGDLFAGFTGDGRPIAGPVGFTMGGGHGGFAAASCEFATFGGAMTVPSNTGIRSDVLNTTYDLGSSNMDEEGDYKPAHTFFKTNRVGGPEVTLEVMSQYTGGDHLPLGEAFRKGDNWAGYSTHF